MEGLAVEWEHLEYILLRTAGGGWTDLNTLVSHGGLGCGVGAPGVQLVHEQSLFSQILVHFPAFTAYK
jgi:hypothetical protein